MYKIEFTPEAVEDLKQFKKTERRFIMHEIEAQLAYIPDVETKNRKRLRPNMLAEWELRIDKFRVFYDVSKAPDLVLVIAIGLKIGSILLIHGERYIL